MDHSDREVIRRLYVRLGRNMEAETLSSYLYQEHVLSEEDMEKIKTKTTSKKKAEKLLKILKKRKNGLKMLIKALLVTKIQDFLGHELLERVTWSDEGKNYSLFKTRLKLLNKTDGEVLFLDMVWYSLVLDSKCLQVALKVADKKESL
jgi:hypothetical protein